MPIDSLVFRGKVIELMASTLEADLRSTAISGRMLEFADGGRAKYVPDDLRNGLLGGIRELSSLISQQAGDLKETKFEDVTVDQLLKAGDLRAPEGSGELDWLIIGRSIEILDEGARIFGELELENPNWRKWTTAAFAVAGVSYIAVCAPGLIAVVTAGASALVVAKAALEMTVAMGEVVAALKELTSHDRQ